MLATDSHRFKCCGPIDSDTRRERLIRVLSLIREARLIRSGAQSDVAPMIEIELGDKLLFRSNFKSSSIKAALLINLMRIYEEIETSSP